MMNNKHCDKKWGIVPYNKITRLHIQQYVHLSFLKTMNFPVEL
jgi:hypothetical protein